MWLGAVRRLRNAVDDDGMATLTFPLILGSATDQL